MFDVGTNFEGHTAPTLSSSAKPARVRPPSALVVAWAERSEQVKARALAALADKPLILRDVALALGETKNLVAKALDALEAEGKAKRVILAHGVRPWAVADYQPAPRKRAPRMRPERIMRKVERMQPVKLEDLAEAIGRGRFPLRKVLGRMRERGQVRQVILNGVWHYVTMNYRQSPAEWHALALQRMKKDEGSSCLLWDGALTPQGHAVARFNGQIDRVDMILWTKVRGKTLKKGNVLVHKCGNNSCCNEDHHKQVTRGEAMKLAGERLGLWSGRARCQKLALQAQEKRGIFTAEDVAAIRASNETDEALAERFKCAKSTIGQVRRYETYRDHGNVFAGLGARHKGLAG